MVKRKRTVKPVYVSKELHRLLSADAQAVGYKLGAMVERLIEEARLERTRRKNRMGGPK